MYHLNLWNIWRGIIYDGIIYVPWLMEFVFLVGTS